MSSNMSAEELRAFNPNVRPSEPYSKRLTGPMFEPKEPIIARLAAVARRKEEQPISGWYGIQRSVTPQVEVPPECMLHEIVHGTSSLGKHPQYRDYPHKLSPEAEKLKKLESGIANLAVSSFKEARELADEQKEVDRAKPELTPTKDEKLKGGKVTGRNPGKKEVTPQKFSK